MVDEKIVLVKDGKLIDKNSLGFVDDFSRLEDDLNFEEPTYREIDICGLVKKMKSKKRLMFNIRREVNQLAALIKLPPKNDECYKMLSVGGGFSSLAIIKFIAELETIDKLYVSTFRIGKAHFEELVRLRNKGFLKEAAFITSSTQERTDKQAKYKDSEYNYYKFLTSKCLEFGWDLKTFDNHSKLILMKTSKNYYVVETSSNLNENPKMEQFSWENDKELFNFYLALFEELLKI